MKALVVFAISCLAFASAQFGFGGNNHKNGNATNSRNNFVLDFVHQYKFVEHHKKNHTLLIAISDVKGEKFCHIIEADSKLTMALKNYKVMINVTEEIYNLIQSGQAMETRVNSSQIFKTYHDRPLVNACRRHKSFLMDYVPSFELPKHNNNNHNHHNRNHHGNHHNNTTPAPSHGHHKTHKPNHKLHRRTTGAPML